MKKPTTLFAALLTLLCVATSSVNAQSQYKNAVKITFLSWFSGSTKISYERAFTTCKQSGEICASMIGAGYCFGKTAETGYYHGFQTFDWLGKYRDNIALSFSIRLGVLF